RDVDGAVGADRALGRATVAIRAQGRAAGRRRARPVGRRAGGHEAAAAVQRLEALVDRRAARALAAADRAEVDDVGIAGRRRAAASTVPDLVTPIVGSQAPWPLRNRRAWGASVTFTRPTPGRKANAVTPEPARPSSGLVPG